MKTSFPPIANADTRILILGSLPGDRSLELGEYYGHAQNRFWKVMANLTGNELAVSYAAKTAMLLEAGIGLWDVAHKARRKGSLDSAIEAVEPNDLAGFLADHTKVKTIGFNGRKAEALFDRFMERNNQIRFISLPSSSPANAAKRLDALCAAWRGLLE